VDGDELAAWLRLVETPKLGRESARKLLAAFGPPERIFAAAASARREVVGPVQVSSLDRPPDGFDALWRDTEAWLADTTTGPRALIPLGDPRYPPALLEAADPPLLLHVQGRIEWLQAPSLAVVGSRTPTPAGRENAHTFAQELSQSGLTIVSGLALGIDGAAHEGALAGRGSTIAVVATGLDDVYPRAHRALAARIAEQGLVVSEYALHTPALAGHFPARNRIIAGLSRGTLVVEAALRSGSLITARLATEAGREVFAIPGSIHAPQSRGTHALIKQGAKLVESAQDVLEELQLPPLRQAQKPPARASNNNETDVPRDALLEALGHDPMGLDELVARTGWSAAELNARLLEKELAGEVARLPGQRFQRLGHA
jgi:DNA processing protein